MDPGRSPEVCHNRSRNPLTRKNLRYMRTTGLRDSWGPGGMVLGWEGLTPSLRLCLGRNTPVVVGLPGLVSRTSTHLSRPTFQVGAGGRRPDPRGPFWPSLVCEFPWVLTCLVLLGTRD